MYYESSLSNIEIQKYSRQIILPHVAPVGQIKLRNSKILIVGLGGLGSPVLMYLASAGVGCIGIMDYDSIEIHNLQRQVIHAESNINLSKIESAAQFVANLNSSIKLVKHKGFMSEESVDKIIADYDIILDCSDNISTRYTLSDHCKIENKDMILASVLKWEGQVFVLPKNGPCYRCLFPEIRERVQNCDEAGVIGPVCGIIGSMQATETLKMILDIDNQANKKSSLIVFDSLKNELKTFDISNKIKNDCIICKKMEYPNSKVMICPPPPPKMEIIDEKNKITWETYFKDTKKYVLVDIRPKMWYEICRIKGSINISANEIEKNPDMVNDFKKPNKTIAIICKRGVSARKIANILLKNSIDCCVIEGGLEKFKANIDESFPID